jgi:tetratricopeptide (TPR) repeat protein
MRQIASVAVVGWFLTVSACTYTKQNYLAKGNDFFKRGRYMDASLNYRKAIQKDPRFGEAYYHLGLAALKLDDVNEALVALSRAVVLLPNNLAAKEKLADLLLALYLSNPNRPQLIYSQLTQLSDQLLAQNANSFQGLRLKGYLAITDGKIPEAIVLFRRALQFKPMDPVVTTALVQVLFQDGKVQEGEKLALDLIAEKPTGPIYQVMYSWYYNSNRVLEAENILKAKVDSNPTQADAILELARHYARVQKSDQMRSALQRLLDDPKGFPQARLLVGNYYFAIQDYPEAIRHYEEGSRTNLKEKSIYQKRIVNALIAEDKREEALKVVQQILKDQPKDDEALRVRATVWLENGRPENVELAAHAFQDLLTRHADDSSLWFKSGQANRLKGDLEMARTQFFEAIKRSKDFLPPRYELAEISLAQQRPNETVQFASEILLVQPNDRRGRVLHAVGLMDTGSLGVARAELTKLTEESPQSGDAWVQLGLLALREKKYQEAVEIFGKLRGGDVRGAAGLAATYSSKNEVARAFRILNDTLKMVPESSLIHWQLANLAATNGQYDLAIAEFRKVLSYDSKSVQQRLRLGEVYELKGDHNSAIATYKEAQELSPKDPISALSLAAALGKAGRTNEARAQYKSILNSHPDNPSALNSLAYLLSETGGDLDEALNLAQRAIKITPGQPSFMDTIGYIYLRKGMRDSAIQTFGNLVRKYPQYPTFRYHLGMALLEKGDKKGARKELETALASHPSREEEAKIKELVGKTQS